MPGEGTSRQGKGARNSHITGVRTDSLEHLGPTSPRRDISKGPTSPRRDFTCIRQNYGTYVPGPIDGGTYGFDTVLLISIVSGMDSGQCL